jgi:hypothetical protein
VSAQNIWLITSTKTGPQTGRFNFWHWNGLRLTQLPNPDPPVASAFSQTTQVVADGHGGAWVQPAEHWTGKRWRYPLRLRAKCAGVPIWIYVVPVPHSWSTWAADSCQQGPSIQGLIDINGPLP